MLWNTAVHESSDSTVWNTYKNISNKLTYYLYCEAQSFLCGVAIAWLAFWVLTHSVVYLRTLEIIRMMHDFMELEQRLYNSLCNSIIRVDTVLGNSILFKDCEPWEIPCCFVSRTARAVFQPRKWILCYPHQYLQHAVLQIKILNRRLWLQVSKVFTSHFVASQV